jgi:hypothetical protein
LEGGERNLRREAGAAGKWVPSMDNGREYSDVNLRPTRVADGLWALLVYDEAEPVRAVERTLVAQGISTRRVRNCFAARAVLREAASPALVLTDVSPP